MLYLLIAPPMTYKNTVHLWMMIILQDMTTTSYREFIFDKQEDLVIQSQLMRCIGITTF